MRRMLRLLAVLWPAVVSAGAPRPIRIAISAEFGHRTSTSAEAIRRGAIIAAAEVNAAGGVLHGRRLEVITRDDRSVPSRAIENVQELAADPDVVAVLTGKFSPVVEELVPVVQELKLPLLAPWSASDPIIDNGYDPSFVFRLSLRDTWAIEALIRGAAQQGLHRIGILLPNTSWGRSSLRAAERYVSRHRSTTLVATTWYNWGDPTLAVQYGSLVRAGAQAVLLVTNEDEGSVFVREVAALPAQERRPIFSHWGVTGGQFPALAGDALQAVSFSVVQTYSFVGAKDATARRVVRALHDQFGVLDDRHIDSPVGVAHAYDLVHLIARAIDAAGTADRTAVRRALERLAPCRGLVRAYRPAFTPTRHEALGPEDVFLARYARDGALVRVDQDRP